MSQTDEKKLYVKISLKNIENESDNFESVTNELEYCYIIKCWKLLLSSVFADAPNYHKKSRKSLTTSVERRRLSP